MQPLDQEYEYVRKHPYPKWFPKKSGLAKRRTTWFGLLLKSDIDKNENHILGPSTIAIAKKFKELIQKDELTIADLEGAGLEWLKHYAARYYKQGIEDMIPGRWCKETHRYIFEALNVMVIGVRGYLFFNHHKIAGEEIIKAYKGSPDESINFQHPSLCLISPYSIFTIFQRTSKSSLSIPCSILIVEEYLLELPSALIQL
ncbi:hypothetical protein Tco_1245381 [Tanacetum coccineum]